MVLSNVRRVKLLTYESNAVILASTEQIWTVLADVTRWHEWTPTMIRVEPLNSGPLQQGSRFSISQPQLRPAVWEVTTWEPFKGFTWESRGLGIRMFADHSITSISEIESRVVLRMTFAGLVGNVVGRLYQKLTEKYLAQEAKSLKQRIESWR
jgi:hypothetical protein